MLEELTTRSAFCGRTRHPFLIHSGFGMVWVKMVQLTVEDILCWPLWAILTRVKFLVQPATVGPDELPFYCSRATTFSPNSCSCIFHPFPSLGSGFLAVPLPKMPHDLKQNGHLRLGTSLMVCPYIPRCVQACTCIHMPGVTCRGAYWRLGVPRTSTHWMGPNTTPSSVTAGPYVGFCCRCSRALAP